MNLLLGRPRVYRDGTRPGRVAAPSLARLAMEPFSALENASFVAGLPLLRLVPTGDGHPVLVLPGFGASDNSTAGLRAALGWMGHDVHGWRLGPNVGPNPRILAGLNSRLVRLHRASGQKVSLVGWSLGGIYAREMARLHPEKVRLVIGLASPFRFRPGDRSHASALYDVLNPFDSPFEGQSAPEQDRPPLPVPSTWIYTRADGIVRWHMCIEEDRPRRENIEVIGTHTGLAHNLAAVVAVADRLAQPAGLWNRFAPPLALRGLYPPPAYWVQGGPDRAERSASATR